MIELLILHDVHSEVQKKLNQWRHDYIIVIQTIGQSTSSAEKTYAVIERSKKPYIAPEYKS